MFTLTLDELRETFEADSVATGDAVTGDGSWLAIEEYAEDRIVVSTEVAPDLARKGGTIAGNTLFRFFDAMGYLMTLAQSPKGTEAFTTDMSIQFLRPGPVGRFLIEGRALRFGRRASVVAVSVTSPLVPEGPVATGVVTFAPVFPSPA